MPQAHTTDQHTVPPGRDPEHRQPHNSKNTIEVEQPAPPPKQDDCKTRLDFSRWYAIANIRF